VQVGLGQRGGDDLDGQTLERAADGVHLTHIVGVQGRRVAGSIDLEDVVRVFPVLRERADRRAEYLSRRRATNARHGPGATHVTICSTD
jgi:hypothetical protein